jgi:hypothetical protein
VKCNVQKCRRKEVLQLPCPGCKIHFCLAHRHMDLHSCSSLNQTNPADKSKWQDEDRNKTNPVSKDVMAKSRKARNKEMADKVQLMKIKSKAALCNLGNDIPTSERVYFIIKKISDCGAGDVKQEAAKHILVVSSNMSFGKVLDKAADLIKMINNNNIPGVRKLHFVTEEKQPVLPLTEFYQKVQYLLNQKIIYNGQTLFLSYL